MSIEDLHDLTPIPELEPDALGAPPAPMAPPALPMAPQMGQPVQDNRNQKLLTLAALATMIAGGKATSGFGSGILQGQQRMENERQQREAQQINERRYQEQQAQSQQLRFQQEQQRYQQTLQQKQKVAFDATQAFRKRVASGEFKDYKGYEAAAKETSALLQNYYGMRVGPQYFMQAATFTAPGEEQMLYDHLDKALKNQSPSRPYGPDDVLTYKGADGAIRKKTVAEAIAFTGYPVILGPDGQFKKVAERPMSPSEAAGAAGDFQDRLTLKLASGVMYQTDEQKAIVNRQIRKEMDADELKKKKAGGDSSVAAEVQGLRADLLREQIESARQKNAPQTNASEAYAGERKQRMLDDVDALLPKVTKWTVGPGSLLAGAPGSDAADFAAELETLKGNIAFNELQEMRNASKTGGALGAVSNVELGLLSSALGSLNTKQSPEAFKKQLQKIRASLQRWEVAKSGQAAPVSSHSAAPGKKYGKYTFEVER
jgi:hypothetical protein